MIIRECSNGDTAFKASALKSRSTEPLEDEETEGDEMFQNAGAKGEPHQDPADPPRRRANKRRGRGTKDNDRTPILGIVGRHSQQLRLRVCQNTNKSPFSLRSRRQPW